MVRRRPSGMLQISPASRRVRRWCENVDLGTSPPAAWHWATDSGPWASSSRTRCSRVGSLRANSRAEEDGHRRGLHDQGDGQDGTPTDVVREPADGPQPTRLIFEIFVIAFLALAAGTALLPETVGRRPGAWAALRPRVSVPVAARRAFLRSTPTLVSTWMLGGLMLSVGGSLLATVFDQGNHAVVGLVLGSFAGAAALASTLLRNRTPQFMTGLGTGLLVAGAVALSVVTVSWPVFVVGTVVAGAGFGPAFLGAFRSVSQLASDHERAGLISAIFIVSYLAFSIPAVLAGILIAVVGLAPTTLGYAGLVTVVAAATLVDQLVARRRG